MVVPVGLQSGNGRIGALSCQTFGVYVARGSLRMKCDFSLRHVDLKIPAADSRVSDEDKIAQLAVPTTVIPLSRPSISLCTVSSYLTINRETLFKSDYRLLAMSTNPKYPIHCGSLGNTLGATSSCSGIVPLVYAWARGIPICALRSLRNGPLLFLCLTCIQQAGFPLLKIYASWRYRSLELSWIEYLPIACSHRHRTMCSIL